MLEAGLVLRVPIENSEGMSAGKSIFKKEQAYASILQRDQFRNSNSQLEGSARGGHAV